MRALARILLLLVVLLPLAGATSLTTGPWKLETNLSDAESREILGQLTFQLQTGSDSHWTISSPTLLLSDANGLSPSVSLSSTCVSGAVGCASSSEVYRSVNGSMLRVGRLQQKDASIFTLPTSSKNSSSAESESSALTNESSTVLGRIGFAPWSMPAEWLWIIALVMVLLITITFLVRNRD